MTSSICSERPDNGHALRRFSEGRSASGPEGRVAKERHTLRERPYSRAIPLSAMRLSVARCGSTYYTIGVRLTFW